MTDWEMYCCSDQIASNILTPKGQCYSDTWVRDCPEQEGKNVTLFARTENLLYLTTVLKFSWLASRKILLQQPLLDGVSEFIWTHHKCRLPLHRIVRLVSRASACSIVSDMVTALYDIPVLFSQQSCCTKEWFLNWCLRRVTGVQCSLLTDVRDPGRGRVCR